MISSSNNVLIMRGSVRGEAQVQSTPAIPDLDLISDSLINELYPYKSEAGLLTANFGIKARVFTLLAAPGVSSLGNIEKVLVTEHLRTLGFGLDRPLLGRDIIMTGHELYDSKTPRNSIGISLYPIDEILALGRNKIIAVYMPSQDQGSKGTVLQLTEKFLVEHRQEPFHLLIRPKLSPFVVDRFGAVRTTMELLPGRIGNPATRYVIENPNKE